MQLLDGAGTIQAMDKVRIQVERCKGCGLCVEVCVRGHLVMSRELNRAGYSYVQTVPERKCTGCGLCFRMCPDVAIEVEGQDGA